MKPHDCPYPVGECGCNLLDTLSTRSGAPEAGSSSCPAPGSLSLGEITTDVETEAGREVERAGTLIADMEEHLRRCIAFRDKCRNARRMADGVGRGASAPTTEAKENDPSSATREEKL